MNNWQRRYERGKKQLLSDSEICKENRELFTAFFEFEEYKLKRRNNLAALDEACYKTLVSYILRLRNVNKWFRNKPWKELTKEDLKRVYDDLEDGRIKNLKGEPFKDKVSYYNKIFKSKPFQMAGKADIAREVMEFSTPRRQEEVRFVTEDSFRQMLSVNHVNALIAANKYDVINVETEGILPGTSSLLRVFDGSKYDDFPVLEAPRLRYAIGNP